MTKHPEQQADLRSALHTAQERIATLEAKLQGELVVDAQVTQAIQVARVGLWAWDIEADVVQWSNGVGLLFGMEPGDFEGTYAAYLSLLPPADRLTVERTMAKTLESGTNYQVEHRILTNSAEPIWLEARGHLFRSKEGTPQRLVGVVVDITERRLAQLRLEESEHRFVVFADASTEGVGISKNGQMVDASKAMCRMFGYELDDLVGTPIADLVAPEHERLVRDKIRSNDREPYRHNAVTKGGDILTVEARGGEITYQGGRARLTALRDVTEEVRLAAEREKLGAQLRQAQKMEAVGQLAGGIAHDFNNILTVILANLEIVGEELEETRLADKIGPLIRDINRAALRAKTLTAQLLAFGRRQPVCPESVHLGKYLGGIRTLLLPLIRENIELRIDGEPDLAAVEVDPGQLQQVVMNLVVNARDAMPLGGVLSLRTEAMKDNGDGAGEKVVLRVTDTGVGMTSSVLARAFDPFFTTKPSGDGTGLGLAMVDGIVEQAGGRVTAASQPGKGTCIELIFPSGPYRASAGAPTSEGGWVPMPCTGEHQAGGAETILICEDNEAIRRLMHSLLSNAGYQVFEADCGDAALAIARDLEHLDLLLTDVIMPGLDGKALSIELLKLHPEANVLFCSGYAENVISRQGLLDSDSFFLSKPFSRTELLGRVRLVLETTTGAEQ